MNCPKCGAKYLSISVVDEGFVRCRVCFYETTTRGYLNDISQGPFEFSVVRHEPNVKYLVTCGAKTIGKLEFSEVEHVISANFMIVHREFADSFAETLRKAFGEKMTIKMDLSTISSDTKCPICGNKTYTVLNDKVMCQKCYCYTMNIARFALCKMMEAGYSLVSGSNVLRDASDQFTVRKPGLFLAHRKIADLRFVTKDSETIITVKQVGKKEEVEKLVEFITSLKLGMRIVELL